MRPRQRSFLLLIVVNAAAADHYSEAAGRWGFRVLVDGRIALLHSQSGQDFDLEDAPEDPMQWARVLDPAGMDMLDWGGLEGPVRMRLTAALVAETIERNLLAADAGGVVVQEGQAPWPEGI